MDTTAYLLNTEANKQRLLSAVDAIRNIDSKQIEEVITSIAPNKKLEDALRKYNKTIILEGQ